MKVGVIKTVLIIDLRITVFQAGATVRRQRDSVVRVGILNVEDLGSNPQLGLLSGFALGDPRGKFTMHYK